MIDFDNFKRSAHRIETLPVYIVEKEKEDFEKFKSGKKFTIPDDDEWLISLKTWTNSGKDISRVRVVSSELSMYEKFEFECYAYNSLHGEKIRIIDKNKYIELTPVDLRGDFWILDDEIVWKMIYSPDGRFIERQPITDSTIVKKFVNLYSTLSQNTFGDYTEADKSL